VRRLVAALLASLLLAGLVAPAVGARPVAAASAVPKVVIVVGPSGAATDRYRAEARAAAELARRFTPDVTEVYSPHATWPAVRSALQGASVVVYMGHGNGWPSKYRDSLFPPTQNGFGLNPSAGSGDDAHQYFGEARIAESIDLAKNAVVLLNHLCYASGNTEPGLPEGTLDQARQRVDNFAAGFIQAGAAAVIAEAYANPNHMLRAVLDGDRSIEAAWRRAPSRNGNVFAFPSERSRGYTALMDPEHGDSGFTRSIVLRSELTSGDVRTHARGTTTPVPAEPALPTLMGTGIDVQPPFIDSALSAGSSLKYKFRYEGAARGELPRALFASVRWDPIDVPIPLTSEEEAPAEPGSPPDLGLVVPERLGDVVEPVKVRIADTAMAFQAAAPAEPGRYRLTITLHDGDGVAFDAPTQALFPPLLVRVTGDLDGRIVAPDRLALERGAQTSLDLWVANLGIEAWGHGAISTTLDPDGSAPAAAARVIGHWVALASDEVSIASAGAATVVAATLPAGLEPGAVVPASVGLVVPTAPGEYLLLLDVEVPGHGSLVAAGLEPTIVRVTVQRTAAPAEQAPVPAPAVDPS
jgi:hypothetical protein